MSAVERFLIARFPGAASTALARDVRGDLRLDTFFVDHGEAIEAYTVVSASLDGIFVPETLSRLPHIPYDVALRDTRPPSEEAPGVFVTIETVHTPCATRARFQHGDAVREATVRADHAVLYTWDTAWPKVADQPRPVALEQNGTWHATVPSLLALPDDFVRAYAAYSGSEDHANWWAVSAFFDARDWDERFTLGMIILDHIDQLDDCHFGVFAAGPIEDLLGHELMDVVEADTGRAAIWQALLRGTYWHLEPVDVRQRVARYLGETG